MCKQALMQYDVQLQEFRNGNENMAPLVAGSIVYIVYSIL